MHLGFLNAVFIISCYSEVELRRKIEKGSVEGSPFEKVIADSLNCSWGPGPERFACCFWVVELRNASRSYPSKQAVWSRCVIVYGRFQTLRHSWPVDILIWTAHDCPFASRFALWCVWTLEMQSRWHLTYISDGPFSLSLSLPLSSVFLSFFLFSFFISVSFTHKDRHRKTLVKIHLQTCLSLRSRMWQHTHIYNISYHITSHHITSYHIISYYIILYYIII